MQKNRLTNLFGIKYPIIQGGMIWNSGWRLASAVSNEGGLGLIGAGSMYPAVFEEHVRNCKEHTRNPFGVNLPLLYPQMDEMIEILLKEEVKIVFTSAGNPRSYTRKLQESGCKVVHVVPSLKFALKVEDAGCDAVVVEGFEAGGHNGRNETTTLCLLQDVKDKLTIPVIAAGGIGTGSAMLAAMVLGADGVQLGSRFAASIEASSHENFKKAVVAAKEGDTLLSLKELTPVRLLRNAFFEKVQEYTEEGRSVEDLRELLGRGRAKKGMFEGDMKEGELEIGQIASCINEVLSVSEIFSKLLHEFESAKETLNNAKFQF